MTTQKGSESGLALPGVGGGGEWLLCTLKVGLIEEIGQEDKASDTQCDPEVRG